jgi:hypothetical protein
VIWLAFRARSNYQSKKLKVETYSSFIVCTSEHFQIQPAVEKRLSHSHTSITIILHLAELIFSISLLWIGVLIGAGCVRG